MRAFFNTTFGPADLEMVDDALKTWRQAHGVSKGSPEHEIAAAIALNLFREGNTTQLALAAAISRHKALSELVTP